MTDTDTAAPIRVMVVDDHPMWRDAVERDLQDAGFDVVGVAANGDQALARFPAARPQVVVLDLQIPAPNGVEVTREVLRQDPSARVLILSASGEQEDVLEAVKAGATGYLVKSASREELLDAVRRVADGDTVFTPGLAGLVLGEFRRHVRRAATPVDETDALTERETEVPEDGRQGDGVQADRRAAGALAPHRAEPRAEHPAQAPDAQPRRADPLRDPAGPRRGRRVTDLRAGSEATAAYLRRLGVEATPRRPRDPGRAAPRAPGRGALREPRDHARPTALGRARGRAWRGSVRGGRAGYCFHQNGALGTVLSELGFESSRRHGHVCTARTSATTTALNHLVCWCAGCPPRTTRSGSWWLDVGLGEGVPRPGPRSRVRVDRTAASTTR